MDKFIIDQVENWINGNTLSLDRTSYKDIIILTVGECNDKQHIRLSKKESLMLASELIKMAINLTD